MRILMVHNRYQVRGGEDASFDAEVRLLREGGHVVETYERDNTEVETRGRLRTAVDTFWSRQSRNEIGELLADGEFDVMHVQNFFPLISPSVYGVARAAGVAVVQTLRNYRLLCAGALLARDGQTCELCLGKRVGLPGIRHRCYRSNLAGSAVVVGMNAFHRFRGTWRKDVDLFIVASAVAKQKHIEGGFREDRIRVKPNVVDFAPDTVAGERVGRAIYVGRLSEEKGVRTIIEAWTKRGIEIPLLVVGDGPLEQELREAAGDHPFIEFTGRVDGAEVCRLISESEVLLLPTECYETFGRTVLEAYAVETPVIASKATAPGDLVRHGETGLHVAQGDPADLARVVKEFFSREEGDRRKMGQAAVAYYRAQFSREENLAIFERIYREAVACRSRSGEGGDAASGRGERVERLS